MQGGLCLGDLCPGVSVHGGLCLGALFGGRSPSRGVSVWGISVQEVSVQGVSVQGALEGASNLCPRIVKSARYPSYWNAFLFTQ